MNEILIYKITKIEKDTIPLLNFYLKLIDDDETEQISMDESTAYERNLKTGDKVMIGPDETLFPLAMAENLGFFDEIDYFSQSQEQDTHQWQMEWMDQYMNALEELDESTSKQ